MGAIGWFGAVIMGVFVYIGGTYLLNNVVTGTSDGEVIITNIVPIALAVLVIGAIVSVFR